MTKPIEKSLNNGFLIIPVEILTAVKYKGTSLGFPEKVVYSYLWRWSTTSEKVFPSASRICQELGIGSRTSVAKYLGKLEELGLIGIERNKGKPSVYKVLPFEGFESKSANKLSLERGTNSEHKEVAETPEPVPTTLCVEAPVKLSTVHLTRCGECGDTISGNELCSCIPF